MLGVWGVIECATVAYAEALVGVSQYNRGGGNRSIVVCGGWSTESGPPALALCEELPIDAGGLPAASSWRSFAPLPFGLADACMLQVNGAVRVCVVSFCA